MASERRFAVMEMTGSSRDSVSVHKPILISTVMSIDL